MQHSATPYFIAMTVAWVVDERHDPPRVCGEDSMLLGRRISVDQAIAHVGLSLALAERLAGDLDRAFELIDEARLRFDRLEDRYGQAYAAAQRGHTLRWIGDYAAADEALAESEALRRALRDQRAVAMSLSGRALAAAEAGAAELARRRGRQAVQMMERSGDNPGIGLTAGNLGVSELVLGQPRAALRWFTDAIGPTAVPGGHRAYAWMCLLRAYLLAELGASGQAEDALALAEAGFDQVGDLPGLSAVQRARKGGLPSVAGNEMS
jgi:tetratricopeptide (TPR) repeat protein